MTLDIFSLTMSVVTFSSSFHNCHSFLIFLRSSQPRSSSTTNRPTSRYWYDWCNLARVRDFCMRSQSFHPLRLCCKLKNQNDIQKQLTNLGSMSTASNALPRSVPVIRERPLLLISSTDDLFSRLFNSSCVWLIKSWMRSTLHCVLPTSV